MSSQFLSIEHPTAHIASLPIAGEVFRERGFLPASDPLTEFPGNSEFSILDELGRDLPSLLHDRAFRQYARGLKNPLWPEGSVRVEDLPALRLYYLRVGFLASAYVNQWARNPC